MDPLQTISPIDGRYRKDVAELAAFFSEGALITYRVMVEVEYLIALSKEKGIPEIPPFTHAQQKQLMSVYERFSLEDAQEIKKIEAKKPVEEAPEKKSFFGFVKEKITTTKIW